MLRSYESYSVKGDGRLNEDALVLHTGLNVYGVVDGVTSLTAFQDAAGNTGGYLAAHLLASCLNKMRDGNSLEEAVVAANRQLRDRMEAEGVDVDDPVAVWAAAFAIVRVYPTKVEFVQAGDCMLLGRYRDGTVRTITYSQVAHLDQYNYTKKMELIRRGVTDPVELRARMLPVSRSNRSKANTLDGYGVMNGGMSFPDFLEKGTFNRANLVKLYLVTDGYYTGMKEWSQLADELDRYGAEGYANRLIEMENADSGLEQYPRLKKSDDKTAIIINLV